MEKNGFINIFVLLVALVIIVAVGVGGYSLMKNSVPSADKQNQQNGPVPGTDTGLSASNTLFFDADSPPFIYANYDSITVKENQKMGGTVSIEKRLDGELYIDGKKVILYSPDLETAKSRNDVREEVIGKVSLNANVYDFLGIHPELIPESWKAKDRHGLDLFVYFFGTIFQDSSGRLLAIEVHIDPENGRLDLLYMPLLDTSPSSLWCSNCYAAVLD